MSNSDMFLACLIVVASTLFVSALVFIMATGLGLIVGSQ